MNLCCMDNTQQKVMCKFLSVFSYVCFSYTNTKMKSEMEKMWLTLSFPFNRWSYGVVLYEISTIGKSLMKFDLTDRGLVAAKVCLGKKEIGRFGIILLPPIRAWARLYLVLVLLRQIFALSDRVGHVLVVVLNICVH